MKDPAELIIEKLNEFIDYVSKNSISNTETIYTTIFFPKDLSKSILTLTKSISELQKKENTKNTLLVKSLVDIQQNLINFINENNLPKNDPKKTFYADFQKQLTQYKNEIILLNDTIDQPYETYEECKKQKILKEYLDDFHFTSIDIAKNIISGLFKTDISLECKNLVHMVNFSPEKENPEPDNPFLNEIFESVEIKNLLLFLKEDPLTEIDENKNITLEEKIIFIAISNAFNIQNEKRDQLNKILKDFKNLDKEIQFEFADLINEKKLSQKIKDIDPSKLLTILKSGNLKNKNFTSIENSLISEIKSHKNLDVLLKILGELNSDNIQKTDTFDYKIEQDFYNKTITQICKVSEIKHLYSILKKLDLEKETHTKLLNTIEDKIYHLSPLNPKNFYFLKNRIKEYQHASQTALYESYNDKEIMLYKNLSSHLDNKLYRKLIALNEEIDLFPLKMARCWDNDDRYRSFINSLLKFYIELEKEKKDFEKNIEKLISEFEEKLKEYKSINPKSHEKIKEILKSFKNKKITGFEFAKQVNNILDDRYLTKSYLASDPPTEFTMITKKLMEKIIRNNFSIRSIEIKNYKNSSEISAIEMKLLSFTIDLNKIKTIENLESFVEKEMGKKFSTLFLSELNQNKDESGELIYSYRESLNKLNEKFKYLIYFDGHFLDDNNFSDIDFIQEQLKKIDGYKKFIENAKTPEERRVVYWAFYKQRKLIEPYTSALSERLNKLTNKEIKVEDKKEDIKLELIITNDTCDNNYILDGNFKNEDKKIEEKLLKEKVEKLTKINFDNLSVTYEDKLDVKKEISIKTTSENLKKDILLMYHSYNVNCGFYSFTNLPDKETITDLIPFYAILVDDKNDISLYLIKNTKEGFKKITFNDTQKNIIKDKFNISSNLFSETESNELTGNKDLYNILSNYPFLNDEELEWLELITEHYSFPLNEYKETIQMDLNLPREIKDLFTDITNNNSKKAIEIMKLILGPHYRGDGSAALGLLPEIQKLQKQRGQYIYYCSEKTKEKSFILYTKCIDKINKMLFPDEKINVSYELFQKEYNDNLPEIVLKQIRDIFLKLRKNDEEPLLEICQDLIITLSQLDKKIQPTVLQFISSHINFIEKDKQIKEISLAITTKRNKNEKIKELNCKNEENEKESCILQ